MITAGGPFVEVCKECLKYGKKIEYCEVDNKMYHTEIIEIINIKRK